MASSRRQYPPRGPVHATLQGEDNTTSLFPLPSRATSAAPADGRGDASTPPPPVLADERSKEAAPAASSGTKESSSAAPLLPRVPARTHASFRSNDAGASTVRSSADFKKESAVLPSAENSSGATCFSLARGGPPGGAGVQEGERSSSATASVIEKEIPRATDESSSEALLFFPRLAARFQSADSAAECRSQWVPGAGFQKGGLHSSPISSRCARSSPCIILASEAASGGITLGSDSGKNVMSTHPAVAMKPPVPNQGVPLCNCKCRKCSDIIDIQDKQRAVSFNKDTQIRFRDFSELTMIADGKEDGKISCYESSSALPRDLIAPEVGEFSVCEEVESSYPGYALGSKYWDQYPASEDLNPAGFSSPHPLWEGFAIPAKLGGQYAFHCVFCGKKFLGTADKGVKHMVRNQGCLIPEVDKQILVDKLNAYRKRKEDLVKRKRIDKRS